ncbi:MAG: CHASE4 domain-containing protein [Desulfovibrio sp.]
MNLRRATIFIICTTFCGLFAVLYAISKGNIQASFNYLEREEVDEELTRGVMALREARKALEITVADWAMWDDTYQFVENGNPGYVRSNITPQSFETVHVGLLLLFDAAGRLILGRTLAADGKDLAPVPEALTQHLTASPFLRQALGGEKAISGVLGAGGEAWLVAACPVLTSLRQGPARGVMVMGQRLDAARIKALGEAVMLDLAVVDLQLPALPPRLKDITATLLRTGDHQIIPEGDALIHGYALLRDVADKPALLVSVTLPRRIHRQKQRTLNNNVVFLLVIGMTFGLAMLYLVERRIVSRITGLSRQIDQLGQSENSRQRTFVDGNDEITGLSKAINAMLAALDHAHSRYEMATRAAKVGIWEFTAQTGAYYVDPGFQELLGYDGAAPPATLEDWMARVHPEDRERARATFAAFLAGSQGDYVCEQRMLDKTGAVHWILVHGRVVRDDAGAVRCVGTNADVTELKRAEASIRKLTGDLIATQEHERARLARELHDNVAQCLSAAKIAGQTLLDGVVLATPAVESRLDDFSALLSRAIAAVREISYDLRPPDLEHLGLPQALKRLCDDFRRVTGIAVDFSQAGLEGLVLDQDLAINLYRVVQEALTNVRRHAGAKHVSVRLVESYPMLIVRIKDDGRGFAVEERMAQAGRERRMGLASMRERMALLGGRLRIVAEPGRGCLIVAEVNYTRERGHGTETDADR